MADRLEIGLGTWALESLGEAPRSWHELYRAAQRTAVHAESLGFESMWFAEHHHVYSGYLPSQFPVMAACAAVTERIKVCGGVTLLPLNGAARIAGGAAALHDLSSGRLRLALGLGYVDREFRAAGIERRERARLFEAYLDELLGDYRAALGNTELWVGAHADKPIVRAARYGRSLLLQQIFDPVEVRRLRTLWEAELRPRADETPRIGLMTPIWASRDPLEIAQARERWDAMGRHYARHIMQDMADAHAAGIDMGAGETFVAGSPGYIVERLAPLVEHGGVDALFLFVQTPSATPTQVHDQMALLAAEVVPHLRAIR